MRLFRLESFTLGGMPGKRFCSSMVAQFRQLTWINSSKLYLLCSTPARPAGRLFFIWLLAASPHAESDEAPCGDPADFVSSGPVDWPHPREVRGTKLGGVPRNLHRCSMVRSCDCCQ